MAATLVLQPLPAATARYHDLRRLRAATRAYRAATHRVIVAEALRPIVTAAHRPIVTTAPRPIVVEVHHLVALEVAAYHTVEVRLEQETLLEGNEKRLSTLKRLFYEEIFSYRRSPIDGLWSNGTRWLHLGVVV